MLCLAAIRPTSAGGNTAAPGAGLNHSGSIIDGTTNPDIRGPSFTQLDLGLAKHQKLFREAAALTLRVEAFNLFNTPHFAPPELGANNSNFGQISVIPVSPASCNSRRS